MIDQKIKLLLHDPAHKKDIDQLNLLNPKEAALMEINEEISAVFYKKYQFRFPEKSLQKVLLQKYPRLDFKSVNSILNYITQTFFDCQLDDSGPSYIYQHRRYQEFLYAKWLKKSFEKDLRMLRENNFLSNADFFRELFLPFISREYLAEGNLAVLQISLIRVYLGEHSGWGADEAPHRNSSQFIPALANQNEKLFDRLIEDENIGLSRLLFVDLKHLDGLFNKWRTGANKYAVSNELRSIRESGIRDQITNTVVLWKAGRKEVSQRILTNLRRVIKKFKDEKFRETGKTPFLPVWECWHDWLYIQLIIDGSNIRN